MDDRIPLIYGEIYKLNETVAKVKYCEDGKEFGYDVININTCNILTKDCSTAVIFHDFLLSASKKRNNEDYDYTVGLPTNFDIVNLFTERMVFESLEEMPAMYRFGNKSKYVAVGVHNEYESTTSYKIYSKRNGRLVAEYDRVKSLSTREMSGTNGIIEGTNGIIAGIEYIDENGDTMIDQFIEKEDESVVVSSSKKEELIYT